MDGSSRTAAGLKLNKLKVFWKLPAAQSQVMTERDRQQRSDVSTGDLLPFRRHKSASPHDKAEGFYYVKTDQTFFDSYCETF